MMRKFTHHRHAASWVFVDLFIELIPRIEFIMLEYLLWCKSTCHHIYIYMYLIGVWYIPV
jgi:hypothetical protein